VKTLSVTGATLTTPCKVFNPFAVNKKLPSKTGKGITRHNKQKPN
jgi:hypothetical protein